MKVILALVFVVIVTVVALLVTSCGTELSMTPALRAVGISTWVNLHIKNPHGVRRISAYIEQQGTRNSVYDQNTPGRRLTFWRHKEPPRSLSFDAGKDAAPNLKEGKARIVVEAVSNDLRGRVDSVAQDVEVVLTTPRATPDEAPHYINQGGMELVTFTPTGSWTEAGVKVGKYSFRSFPIPGAGDSRRFAMFAYPWDLRPGVTPVVYVRNSAGAEVTGRFWFKLFPRKFRARELNIDDRFLEKVVNQIDPAGTLAPGPDLISRFLKINGELRRKNNQQLSDLRLKSEEKMLWNGPFIHYGKEESMFADVRTYLYKGKKVDQQVHLGFDLSDVQNAPVNAANAGRVVWASDLGIYGNCVVLDHGYALESMYGHLQRIDVRVGDLVKKGQTMAVAGSTGLAGGVHVHFSMLLDGVQVNPMEWWDEHWIHDRILSKLEPAKAQER